MDVFKRGVLELALKQVNEHTDITATYEQHKKGQWLRASHSSLSRRSPNKPKIATETPKTATNDLDTIKPLTEPQIAKYSMILCKLGSISDLSNFPDYPTFANWIGNILRSPEKADEQTAKRIFTALKTETDYGKKNVWTSKLLLEIERLNKEIIKLKEVIENKNAHVESKNKHIARLEKIISIMKKRWTYNFWFSPKGTT